MHICKARGLTDPCYIQALPHHLSGISTLHNRLLTKNKPRQEWGHSQNPCQKRSTSTPPSNTVRALKQLRSPVAVDGDGDDEQHGHDDGGDDDVEWQIVLLLVLHRAHNPLAFAKLDLCACAERKRVCYGVHEMSERSACAGPVSRWQLG